MTDRSGQGVKHGSRGREQGTDPRTGTVHTHDDTCRCKEASTMTPRELLKLMIDDLAFWKKEKK